METCTRGHIHIHTHIAPQNLVFKQLQLYRALLFGVQSADCLGAQHPPRQQEIKIREASFTEQDAASTEGAGQSTDSRLGSLTPNQGLEYL